MPTPNTRPSRMGSWDAAAHGPWGSWYAGERPPRALRWIPVVLAQLIQLPFVIWVIATGRPAVEIAAVLLAFFASYLLLLVPRHPGPALVAIALASAPALLFFRVGPPTSAVPLAFAVVAATALGARAWVWSTVGAAAVITILVGTFTDARGAILRPLVILLVLSLLIGLGEGARNRRERFAEIRALQQRRRRNEAERERLRIARELHDVLAHSLSSINVQASVGLHLMDEQPEKAAEALAAIKETSRSALDEVRGVLGFLRSGADGAAPQTVDPELSRLPALITSMSALGVKAELVGTLPEDAPTIVQRTIYRIVQEALTNITRHSDGTTATVTLSTSGGSDVITVHDDGTPVPSLPIEFGRGLVGMRERAELLGGTLRAGWADDGGFLVEARLPRRVPA